MCAQLHTQTHTHTLCFDVNSSRRGVQSTTPPVFLLLPPSFFPLVFHCFPPCDTFSGMSRNPVLKHTHIHTHSHIHIMPCSQPKLCTFVRGEQLKHAHLHTHIHAHSCLNFSLSLSLRAHTNTRTSLHHLSRLPFTISCPPRLSVSCLVSCVRDCGWLWRG